MSKVRGWLVLCGACVLLLALAGCDGVKGEATFTFAPDGSFSEQIQVDGVALASDDLASLKGDGWKVDEHDGGFELSRECSSVADFDKGYASAVTAAFNAAGQDAAASETKIDCTTTDYFFAKRHDVTLSLPDLHLDPTVCSVCGGSGTSTCGECGGDGWEVCSDCGGSGVSEGYWWDYTCYTCDGTGRVDCYECDGSGEVYCVACDGTGEPTQEDVDRYKNALDDSSLLVTVNMPGMVFEKSDALVWEFKGNDLEDLGKLSASSYVIAWLPTGLAAGAILLLLVAGVWLVVRGIRRALANSRARSAAKREVKARAAVVTPVAANVPQVPPSAATKFCRKCGAPMGVVSQFCPKCGTPTTVEQTKE